MGNRVLYSNLWGLAGVAVVALVVLACATVAIMVGAGAYYTYLWVQETWGQYHGLPLLAPAFIVFMLVASVVAAWREGDSYF